MKKIKKKEQKNIKKKRNNRIILVNIYSQAKIIFMEEIQYGMGQIKEIFCKGKRTSKGS